MFRLLADKVIKLHHVHLKLNAEALVLTIRGFLWPVKLLAETFSSVFSLLKMIEILYDNR